MVVAPASEVPTTDDRDPGQLISESVEAVLGLASTWLGWSDVATHSDGSIATPVKALRRASDHLLDHLAELECLLAGAEPMTDTWHGRMVTLDSDWGRFTELDLDEAASS